MSLDKSDVLGSIFTGWWEADKADTAQKLKTRSQELQNKQSIIKQMKTADYNKEIEKYDADKKVIDGLNSVAANKSMYSDDLQLGQAVLIAKHGDKFDSFKKSLTGADGDLTQFYNFAKSEGQNFNKSGTEGTQISKNFKDKSVIDSEYQAALAEIEKDTKDAIDAAAGDSKTINAIMKLKNRLVNNISTDTKNVKTIDSVNETIKATGVNETETLKKIESDIKSDEEIIVEEVDTEADEVSTLKSADVPLFIPKTYKEDYKKKIEKAKETDYSSKEYNKQFSDTVLTLIPNKNSKDYFNIDKEGTMTAKSSIINADVTIQKLLTNSLDDITLNNTFQQTGKDTTAIDFNANKRFQLAKSHIENYGTWMADGKVLSGGSLKNLFKETSTALVVPSNSIINLNNNNLKGYDIIIPKDLRNDVGKVYTNFIKTKAQTRMETAGGTLEENINFLQRQLQDDNNGNESLTQQARDYIARALKGSGISVNKIGTTSTNETSKSTKSKQSSTMDIKQKEMEDVTIGGVRTVMVDINGDGTKTQVPLTTKNKQILKANNISIPDVQEESTAGDGSIMEQVASETETKKITPQDVGVSGGTNFFENKEDVFAILPNDMTGQEIMDKYNISFPLNKFTVYKSTK